MQYLKQLNRRYKLIKEPCESTPVDSKVTHILHSDTEVGWRGLLLEIIPPLLFPSPEKHHWDVLEISFLRTNRT